jgi:hypothetical protein
VQRDFVYDETINEEASRLEIALRNLDWIAGPSCTAVTHHPQEAIAMMAQVRVRDPFSVETEEMDVSESRPSVRVHAVVECGFVDGYEEGEDFSLYLHRLCNASS